MPRLGSAPDVADLDRLAANLKALAHPSRLDVLWQLRTPRGLGDLRVRPRRHATLNPARSMSRQTLAVHLEKLEEIGAVVRLPQDASRGLEWVTNVPQLFGLWEEMRALTTIPAAAALEADATSPVAGSGPPKWPRGPKFVLPAGPWEGRVIPLTGSSEWTIGRSRRCGIALTYDPFVSTEHARVTAKGSSFAVHAFEDARNEVVVNDTVVLPGGAAELQHGDLLSLGRSTLLFRAE